MIATCLFTGERLDDSTRIEHTIPESLCGRIGSRTVSSDAFNNNCSRFDRELARSFAPFVSALGPLLASRHQAGDINVSVGQEGDFIVKPGSILSRKDVQIDLDEAGRPKWITGPNGKVERIAKRNKWEIRNSKMVPGAETKAVDIQSPLISQEIEVAALKATLLTFDEVFRDDPKRFTRDEASKPVLDAIHDIVMNQGRGLTDFSVKHTRGINPSLAEQMSALFIPNDIHRFSHVLVAMGSADTRTINCAWSIFGFEPHTFHLSNCWNGESFTLAVRAPVLKNAPPLEKIRLSKSFPIYGFTSARSIDAERGGPEVAIIAQLHAQAIGEARLQSLTTSDAYVLEQIEFYRQELFANGKPSTILDSIVELLETLYAVHRSRYGRGCEVDATLRDIRTMASHYLEDESIPRVSCFRSALNMLMGVIGPPLFEHACSVEITKIPARNY